MGGVGAEEGVRILDGSPTRYLPFAGNPTGHPTRLGGAAHEVEAHCRAFATLGCAGVDILAYRATEAEPLDLVAACRRGFADKGLVVAAGSIDCAERVERRPRSRRRRIHYRHRGDRGLLRARRWAAGSATPGGAEGLRDGGREAMKRAQATAPAAFRGDGREA